MVVSVPSLQMLRSVIRLLMYQHDNKLTAKTNAPPVKPPARPPENPFAAAPSTPPAAFCSVDWNRARPALKRVGVLKVRAAALVAVLDEIIMCDVRF